MLTPTPETTPDSSIASHHTQKRQQVMMKDQNSGKAGTGDFKKGSAAVKSEPERADNDDEAETK